MVSALKRVTSKFLNFLFVFLINMNFLLLTCRYGGPCYSYIGALYFIDIFSRRHITLVEIFFFFFKFRSFILKLESFFLKKKIFSCSRNPRWVLKLLLIIRFNNVNNSFVYRQLALMDRNSAISKFFFFIILI